MFPACVRLGLYLIEWKRHIVDTSYFETAQPVHSSGCKLQLTSQVVPLRASMFKSIKQGGTFLTCNKLIIYWPDITRPGKAEKHYK